MVDGLPPLIVETTGYRSPESLLPWLGDQSVVLRSATHESERSRYSFVAARPFLIFESRGAQCQMVQGGRTEAQFGNPWVVLEGLMSRYELLDEVDLPFPLGGCFGYWGYDMRRFVEPHLPASAVADLDLPDSWLGFYDSLLVFDHKLERIWIVSTGLTADGTRHRTRAEESIAFWKRILEKPEIPALIDRNGFSSPPILHSNLSRSSFLARIQRAQRYIRQGDIYQVNLSQRFQLSEPVPASGLFQQLLDLSPAPFAGLLDAGPFQVISSSPELFLRMSGNHIETRPIKGTRPRDSDPSRDAQLMYELQTSPKEMAELVMITDLLRNDLGRICDYGTVLVPELVRLERFAQVQHLVSTIEGRLREPTSHAAALASMFPGGSITGAPKIRAMEIIDELEPVSRGPYTGCLGYLGFNRESQLSILIRSAIHCPDGTFFQTGAGIVADSVAEAEFDETLAKAEGFRIAISRLCGANAVIESRL